MNHLFPRVFASTSQSSSRPRAINKKFASSSSGGQSYALGSVRSDVVISNEKSGSGQLLAAPPPSRQAVRPVSRMGWRRERRYGELDDENGSDDSSDMIILQRGSVAVGEDGWKGESKV